MTIYLKTLNYGFLTIVNYLINLCSNWVMQLWSLTKVYGRYFEVLSGLWFPTSLRGSIALSRWPVTNDGGNQVHRVHLKSSQTKSPGSWTPPHPLVRWPPHIPRFRTSARHRPDPVSWASHGSQHWPRPRGPRLDTPPAMAWCPNRMETYDLEHLRNQTFLAPLETTMMWHGQRWQRQPEW